MSNLCRSMYFEVTVHERHLVLSSDVQSLYIYCAHWVSLVQLMGDTVSWRFHDRVALPKSA